MRLSLSDLQRRFKEALKAGKTDFVSLPIKDGPPIDAERRLGIYQFAYWARLVEVLEADFPGVAKLLGEKKFTNICREFLKSFPSRFWTVLEVGRRFPLFLRKSPVLLEVADFEWRKSVSRVSAAVDPFPFESLAALSPGEQELVILQLNPSVFLAEYERPVHEIESKDWKLTTVPKSRTRLVIFRKAGEVIARPLDVSQWTLLTEISKGVTIRELVAKLPETGTAAQKRLFEWFASWVEDEIVAGFSTSAFAGKESRYVH